MGKTKSCSFCHRGKNEVSKLISGSSEVCICDECVEQCALLVAGDNPTEEPEINLSQVVPEELFSYMNSYVIGQECAKKTLAVAVYNHYKRLNIALDSEVELSKSNVLMLGPTGSGKTLMAQCLAKKLNVPFAIVDATTLTEAGYVGEDVENIVLSLIINADYDIARAEKGIIYVDEIDKISRKSGNPSITRDVSGEGVQQALLKILEGTIVSVPPKGGRKHPDQEYIKIDTKNILFICAGAFSGLEKVISHRLDHHSIGFSAEVVKAEQKTNILREVQAEDLISFGLIPELIGRLPVVTSLQELTEDQLVKVLVEPKNSLVKQYQLLFAMDNIELHFSECALRAVANIAIKRKSGARGLRAVFESLLLDAMFGAPSGDMRSLVIDKSFVEANLEDYK